MPTYEYQCENGHSFEEFQSIVASPIDKCPECGAAAHRKISGGTGLIFKGSGFYLTDYVKKNGSPAGSESTPPKKNAAQSETKSESSAGSTAKPDTGAKS